MTHATPLEIHDHVYGFRPSDHVAGCAECQASADSLVAEASVIGAALRETPVSPPQELLRNPRARRSRITAGGLAAAGLLLIGLAWALSHDPRSIPPEPPDKTPGRSADPEMERLVRELRSPSPAHRQIAVLALKSYGEAALAAITQSGVGPELFGTYRLKPADDAVRRTLESKKTDLDMENVFLKDILSSLSQKTGLKFVMDPAFRQRLNPDQKITFKVKDLTVNNTLKLLFMQLNANFRCEDGAVVILDEKDGPSGIPVPARAPLRIGKRKAAAVGMLAEFRSDSIERREAARQGLMTMGFAAEEALWEALDSTDPETKGQALEVLRWLYTPDESARPLSHPRTRSIKKLLSEKRVTVDFKETPLLQALDSIRQLSGANLHVSGVQTPDSLRVTMAGTDLPVYSALVLLLEPLRVACAFREDIVLLSPEAASPEEAPRKLGNFWTSPEEARRLEGALIDLAEGPPAAQERASATLAGLGDRALPLLERAAEILDGVGRERCRTLRERLQTTIDPKGLDEPTAADLTVRTAHQEDLLHQTADLDIDGLSLDRILQRYGIPIDIRSKPDRTFRFHAKEIRLETALRALTMPFGLDFMFKGDQLIIDRADAVRARIRR